MLAPFYFSSGRHSRKNTQQANNDAKNTRIYLHHLKNANEQNEVKSFLFFRYQNLMFHEITAVVLLLYATKKSLSITTALPYTT